MRAELMHDKAKMFGIAILILTLITAAALGLMTSPTNPFTWILIGLLVLLPFIHRRLISGQYVEWKNEYSVGIDSIDMQHKKLLGLINSLQTAVDFSTGELFEREALDELVDYTRSHFSYEEGLMEQNAYPEFEAHRKQHQQMIARVEEVLAEYQQDKDSAMRNAAAFLRSWLIKHINGTDKQYSSFLIEKGVK